METVVGKRANHLGQSRMPSAVINARMHLNMYILKILDYSDSMFGFGYTYLYI